MAATISVERSENRVQVDMTTPEAVEIQIRSDRKVVWVNVDGYCALRICGIDPEKFVLIDESDNAH